MIPTELQLGKKITKKQLEEAGIYVSSWASDILSKVKFGKKRKVKIVVKSVKELGFTNMAKYEDVCKKIIELGYELCPSEVGPALRLAYKDQPNDEWLWLAMESVVDAYGVLGVFYVVHGDGGLWLDGGSGNPCTLYNPDNQFVCLVPRKLGKLEKSDFGDLESRVKELESDMVKLKKIILI